MKADELDRKFDAGEDVLEYFHLSTLKRPGLKTQTVEIEFPQWIVAALDQEAERLGVQ